MTQARNDKVSARIEAVLPDGRQHWRGAAICRLGSDVRLSYDGLANYCLQNPSGVDIDLLVVAGVCAHADRSIPRRRATQWARKLDILIPVHDPERWNSPPLLSALHETLRYLSGDDWTISFAHRRQDNRALQLPLVSPGWQIQVVLPYSGGLDSFAELRRLSADEPRTRLFLVTTEHTSAARSLAGRTAEPAAHGYYRAGVPITLSPGGHPDQTFRTRTFLFYAVAALAWKLAGAEWISIPETGQGALGPSLAMYGNEHPYRSTHPGFTRLLQQLLRELWGKAPRFVHPHLWSTKGQFLRELSERSLLTGYGQTRSCAASLRRKGRRGLPSHCGVCAACLLRRMALKTAIGTDGEDYVWKHLGARDLAASVAPGLEIMTTDNDNNIAVHGVLCHQHLADVATASTSPTFAQAAFEIGQILDMQPAEAHTKIAGLVQQHAREWTAFLEGLPAESWVAQLLRGE